jgi:hypothetical protein
MEAEVNVLRAAEGCTRQDGLQNADTRKEFGVELMQKCNMLHRQLEITHRKNTRANNEMSAKGIQIQLPLGSVKPEQA